jgi:hypothetical protein
MSGNNAGEPLFVNLTRSQFLVLEIGTPLLDFMLSVHPQYCTVGSYVRKSFPDFCWFKQFTFFFAVCTKNILTRSMWNMPPSHHYVLIFFLGNASGRFLASHVRLVNLRYLISGKTLEKEHGLRIVHVNYQCST